MAQALLRPAALARTDPTPAPALTPDPTPAPAPSPASSTPSQSLTILPIEEVTLPAADVSDLKDVFDAINRLCETMRDSEFSDEPTLTECTDGLVDPREVIVRKVEIFHARHWTDDDESLPDSIETELNESREAVTSSVVNNEVSAPQVDNGDQWKDSQVSLTSSEVSVQREERWSDTLTSPPGIVDEMETLTSDTVPPCEQMSEMYYTASSEVSLLSDTDVPDKGNGEESDKDERKECVIAGHVAAMRERFESMTRANTPCPDLIRSSSPSLDVFRNITPSPDRLG